MSEKRLRLGEILIDAGVLTEQQLARALSIQKEDDRRLGSILMSYGFVAEPQLVQALSRQLSVPWVSLWHVDVPEDLLELVPVEVAKDCCAVPVYVRSDREQGVSLYVAMDDPTNEEAIRRVSVSARMPVKAMVAGPTDIASAIEEFYGSAESAEARDTERPTRVESKTGRSKRSTPPPSPEREELAPAVDSGVESAAEEEHEGSQPLDEQLAIAAESAEDTHDEIVTLDESHVVESDSVEVDVNVVENSPVERVPSISDTIDERLDVLEAAAADRANEAKTELAEDEEPEAGTDSEPPAPGSGATMVKLDADVEELAHADDSFEDEDDGKELQEESRELQEVSEELQDESKELHGEPKEVKEEAAEDEDEPPPKPRARVRPRALALTLLDGTTIELKGSTHKEDEKISSVPELVSLLRAAAKGSPLPKPLPSTRWELYVAHLIELLVSKRLLTEEEILERLIH